MASKDLELIRQKLFLESPPWSILGYQVYVANPQDSGTISVDIVREEELTTLVSREGDVQDFVLNFHTLFDAKGNPVFRRVRDNNAFFRDLENLTQNVEDKERAEMQMLVAKKVTLGFHPYGLLDEALRHELRAYAKKFLPLKDQYFRHRAHFKIVMMQRVKRHESLLARDAVTKRFIEACQQVLMGFGDRGNALKDYHRYTQYLDVDLDEWHEVAKPQFEMASQSLDDLAQGTPKPATVVVHRLLPIYNNLLEVLKPVINALRASLQLWNGVRDPPMEQGLTENIQFLRSDARQGAVFSFLNHTVRNSWAHAAYRVVGDKVEFLDTRTKLTVVETIPVSKLIEMTVDMRGCFFPAAYDALMMLKLVDVYLVLQSPEYRLYLAGIGNAD